MTALTNGSPWKTDFYHSNVSSVPSTRNFHIRADTGKVTLEYLWGVTPDFSGGPDIKLGSLVQITGALFSLLLFTVLWFLVKENRRVQKKIEKRTAELSAAVEDINNEIKEKIQAEQALKASSERLKALSNASFEAILLSEKGICVDVNNTAVKMFGYSREEAIGAAATIIFAPDQLEIVLKNIQSEQEVPYEVIATRKDGTTFPVHIQGRTIDYFGRRVRVTAISDITDRKNAEQDKEKLTEQLHQAKKMESIGLMAGGVAHDLNNILSGIIGYPELLLQALPAGSKLRKPIEAIRESGQRAATVVADLLTVARGAATSKTIHDLNELVHEYFASPECLRLNSLYPEVTCRHQCTARRPALCCSAVHVKKCLMNLVLNGVEAIPGQGTVVVSTSNIHLDDTAAGEHDLEAGEYVVLQVQDTGPGIADADLQHIFEPFYTRKEMGRSGTGLGLTVVWNTMEDHGGKVSVQSSPQGTYFTLYFPLSTEEIPLSSEHDQEKYCAANEHILIVDDEPQLRDIAARILQNAGYRIDTVASGELAVDFVRKTPVDLLIIDMMMGSGMNGQKTYEKILAIHPGQKAIVASGFSESTDVKATLRLGAGGFIKKPYSMEQLNKIVHEVLGHEPESS
jgi:PAS domain S-box-containing protein